MSFFSPPSSPPRTPHTPRTPALFRQLTTPPPSPLLAAQQQAQADIGAAAATAAAHHGLQTRVADHEERLRFLDPELKAAASRLEVLEHFNESNLDQIGHLDERVRRCEEEHRRGLLPVREGGGEQERDVGPGMFVPGMEEWDWSLGSAASSYSLTPGSPTPMPSYAHSEGYENGFTMSVDLRQTSDQLWYHALQFLDEFRLQDTRVDSKEFYQYENAILSKHETMMRENFGGDSSSAKVRDMYIELIKMIFDEEQRICPKSYQETKDIHKLQGYQELTNRLQRSLNLKLFQQLEAHTTIFAAHDQKFEVHAAQLKAQAVTIDRLEGLLKDLLDRDEVDSSSLKVQKDTLQVLGKRIDTNETHINLLEDKDRDQDIGYENLRKEIKELQDKDVYLEQTTTFTANQIKETDVRVEKMGKDVTRNEIDIEELKAKDLFLEEAHKQAMHRMNEMDEARHKIAIDVKSVEGKLESTTKEMKEDIEDVEDAVEEKNKAIWKRLDELNNVDLDALGKIEMQHTTIQALERTSIDLKETDADIIKRLDDLNLNMSNIDVKIEIAKEAEHKHELAQTTHLEEGLNGLAIKLKRLEGISNENAEVINQYTLNQLSMSEQINNDLNTLQMNQNGKLDKLEVRLIADVEMGERLQKRVEELKPEIASLVEETMVPKVIKTVEENLMPVQKDVDFLKENLKEKDKDMEKQAVELKVEIEDLRGSKVQIEQGYDEAIGRLEAGLKKNTEELDLESLRLGKLAELVGHHDDRIGMLERRDEELFGEVQSKEQALKQLAETLQGTNSKLTELDDRNHQVLDRTNSLEEHLRKDIVDLAQVRKDLEAQLKNVDGQCLDNLENIVALKEFNNNKAEEATQLQISIQNIEAEKQQSVASLQDELSQKRSDLEKELEALKDDIQSLVKEDQAIWKRVDDIVSHDLQDKIHKIQEEVSDFDEKNKMLLQGLMDEDNHLLQRINSVAIDVKHFADDTDGKVQSLAKEDQAIWKRVGEIISHDVREEIQKIQIEVADFDEKNKVLLQGLMDEDGHLLKRIEAITGDVQQASADTEAKIRDQLALTIELTVEKGKEDSEDRFKVFQGIIDDKIHEVDTINDKNKKHVDNLRDLNEKLLEEIKNAVVSDVDQLKEDRTKVDANLESLEDRLQKMGFNLKDIEDAQKDLAQAASSVDEGFGERLIIVETDIKTLGKGSKDLEKQIEELEKADTFLQEANKIAMNKIQGVEEDGKKTLGVVDLMGTDIKNVKIEIEEKDVRLKEDLQKQSDEDNAIWKKIDDLVETDDKLKSRLDHIEGDITILRNDVTDFDEKNKILIQGLMDEDQALTRRIDGLDGELKGFNVRIEVLQHDEKKQSDNLKQGVEVKILELEDMGKKNEHSIESLLVSYDDLEVKMGDKIDQVDQKQIGKVQELQKIIEDLDDGKNKLEKAIEVLKPELIEVVEERLGGQIERVFEEKVKPVLEKEQVLEDRLEGMQRVIEEVKEDVKENDVDIDKKAEEISIKIDNIKIHQEQAFQEDNSKLYAELKQLRGQLDQAVDDQDKRMNSLVKELKENEDDIEENEENLDKLKKQVNDLEEKTEGRFHVLDENKKVVAGQILDCDGRIKDNLEQIVALKEQTNNKVEESTLLQLSIHKLESEKQQSDAEQRDEFDRHSKQLQDVQDELKKRVASHDERLDIHDKQIGELQSQQRDGTLEKRVTRLEEATNTLQEDQDHINSEVKVQNKKLEGVKSNLDECRGDLNNLDETTKKDIQRLVDEDQAIWQKLDQLEVKDKQLTEQCQDSQGHIQSLRGEMNELRLLLEELQKKLRGERELDEDELKQLRDMIDDKVHEMSRFTEKNNKTVEELRDLNGKLLIEIKNTVEVDMDDLNNKHSNMERSLVDLLAKIELLEVNLKDLEGKEKEEALNIVIQQTNVLKESLEKEMRAQINVVDEGFSERLTTAEVKVQVLQEGHTSNRQSINEILENVKEVDGACRETKIKTNETTMSLTQGIKITNQNMEQQEQNFWTLILEIYGALRGFTVLLKSDGNAALEQSRCMGVYRVVDHFGDRPLYRQDEGDHFLYWNAKHRCWMVGSKPGSDFGWIKNKTQDQDKLHHIPDLASGWLYQPLTRENTDPHWQSDDPTLHVEILRDVDIIKQTITDIKNAREVD